MVHVPVEQLPVPCGGAQGVLQSPQCVLVLVGCSQPGAASQSARPGAQPVPTQVPEAQEALPPEIEQGIPQPPQSVSVRVLVSQPFVPIRSQSA